MRTINIENQKTIISKMERMSYEVECRKNILEFLITQNQLNSETYQNYWEEYLMYRKAFDKLKYDFSQQYIVPVAKNLETTHWKIDFNTGEIQIYD